MVRMLISAAIHLLANAVGLLVADALLDDMEIVGVTPFVIAVVIFTVTEVLIQPLLQKMALSNVPALMGGTALAATLIGLIVTSIVSGDDFEIVGATTWLLATLIVWLAAVLAALILPLILVKKAVDDTDRR